MIHNRGGTCWYYLVLPALYTACKAIDENRYVLDKLERLSKKHIAEKESVISLLDRHKFNVGNDCDNWLMIQSVDHFFKCSTNGSRLHN